MAINNAEQLFSINTLPKDKEFLKKLRKKINNMLGNTAVDVNSELLENMAVAKALRNELCMLPHDSFDEDDQSIPKKEYRLRDIDDIKDSARVSSVRAFTDILKDLISLQETINSQQANALLQDSIIEVLDSYDEKIKEKVVDLFTEKIRELERTAK